MKSISEQQINELEEKRDMVERMKREEIVQNELIQQQHRTALRELQDRIHKIKEEEVKKLIS